MKKFILDCSFTMAWCFEDESNEQADAILAFLTDENPARAFVPSLWYLEVVNVLKTAEKKERLTEAESLQFLNLIYNLPIENDITTYPTKDLLSMARAYNLSAYDANYLLLAINRNLPLATLDAKLQQGANKAHIPLVL